MANHTLSDDEYRWFRKMATWYKGRADGGSGPGRTPTETFEPVVRMVELPNAGIPGWDVTEDSDGKESYSCHAADCNVKAYGTRVPVEDSDTLCDELGTRPLVDRQDPFVKHVLNASAWGASWVNTDTSFTGENGDTGQVVGWPTGQGDVVVHHHGNPPLQLAFDRCLYDTADPFSGSTTKFDSSYPGRVEFRTTYRAGEPAKSGVEIVEDEDTYDHASLILRQGIWRLDVNFKVAIDSLYTITYTDDNGDDVDVMRHAGAELHVFFSKSSWDYWLGMYNLPVTCSGSLTSNLCGAGLLLPLSEDDYELKFVLTGDGTTKKITPRAASTITLQRLDGHPWSYSFLDPT